MDRFTRRARALALAVTTAALVSAGPARAAVKNTNPDQGACLNGFATPEGTGIVVKSPEGTVHVWLDAKLNLHGQVCENGEWKQVK
jgi:hypothetical protein